MRTLFLLTSGVCDLRCAYCFYQTKHAKRPSGRVSAHQASRTATRIAQHFSTVILTGGDPLATALREHTYALCRALAQAGVRVILCTSGVLLAEADLDTIAALRPARVDLSIDSCVTEVHDIQRGRHADTVRTLEDAGVTVLLDARDVSIGRKLVDARLIGAPYLVVLGPRTNVGHAELEHRTLPVRETLHHHALVSTLADAARYT